MLEQNPPYNEKELLLRIAEGDERAFSEVVRHYTRILYPFLLYLVKKTQEVEELVQDIFVQIWKKRDQLDQINNFSGYIYVMARNQAYAVLKARLSAPEVLTHEPMEDLLSSPQATAEFKELAELLEKAIEALPPRRKMVFRLSREERLTYEEIAEKLQISRSTVREHMVQALVFLRMYIREHGGIIIAWMLLFISYFSKN